MILLDTHIWIWWAHGSDGLGISMISCWEVTKLVEYQSLVLACPVPEWFERARSYPGIQLIDLTPAIAYESTRLPGEFHRDPADQMIVATARIHEIPLLTADSKLLAYPHVKILS